jgi:hypothetical protein
MTDKKQTELPGFPVVDALDDTAAILDSANGSCGVLADNLSASGVGSDIVRAVYAIAYLIEAAREKLAPLHTELLRYKSGL